MTLVLYNYAPGATDSMTWVGGGATAATATERRVGVNPMVVHAGRLMVRGAAATLMVWETVKWP
jgi:hypothetical protein